MQGLAFSVLCVGLAMLVWSSAATPQTGSGLVRTADDICAAPPFDNRSRSLVRRLPGYDRVLDHLVDHCPDVAMLFAQFATGAVPPAPVQRPVEYLWRLDFPQLQVQAENQ